MISLKQKIDDSAVLLRSKWAGEDTPIAFLRFADGFATDALLDEEIFSLPLTELPGIPKTSASTSPKLVYGRCGNNGLLLQAGRYCVYDGFGTDPCVLPVCAAVRAGVENILCVDWCGSMRSELKPGTWIVLTDYINGMGTSPLIGNFDIVDDPFVDMTDAFSQELNADFINAAAEENLSPRLVVGYSHCGPQFLSPAEIAMVQNSGADVVTMSLIPEAIAVHALGAKITAVALVTHAAAQYGRRRICKADITEECRYNSATAIKSIRNLIAKLSVEATP